MLQKQSSLLLILLFPFFLCAQVSEQWASRYSFTSGTDRANAFALDDSGNVYVTGSSQSGGFGSEDYATIKYNSSGVQQWINRYNGPATGINTDIAHAIAIDASGYIYVTGESTALNGYRDYLTIKYDWNGDTLWTARYNGPRNNNDIAYALAISDSGNIYVTGSSEGLVGTHGIFEDYLTVKYNSIGVQQWAVAYNGPGGDADYAYSITVDTVGSVYVTGESGGGSTGSADSYQDFATIKYNSAGVQQWLSRYTGILTTSNDVAREIKIDPSGYVYVTGFSNGIIAGHDCLTIKYNPTGGVEWIARYNGMGDNEDAAESIALDDSGNVFITGNTYTNSINDYDIVTVKYNSLGVEQWDNVHNGSASGFDGGNSILTDKASNIYVTGHVSQFSTSLDYITLKYSPSGVEEWSVTYTNSGVAGGSDEPSSIGIDSAGNIYVTGVSSLDYATIKYAQTPVYISAIENNSGIWNIYSDPAINKLHINCKNSITQNHSLQITDISGSVIINGLVTKSENEFDLSFLKSGIYFARIFGRHYYQNSKIVILK